MANKTITDYIREPLTETTRRARRNTLVASVVGIVVVEASLIPTKIVAFGITFNQSNQESFLTLILLLVWYFAITFMVYLYSEMFAWKFALRIDEFKELKEERDAGVYENQSQVVEFYNKSIKSISGFAKLVFIARVLFEAVVPILIFMYSASLLMGANAVEMVEANKAVQLVHLSCAKKT
jgi:hypothetical protein